MADLFSGVDVNPPSSHAVTLDRPLAAGGTVRAAYMRSSVITIETTAALAYAVLPTWKVRHGQRGGRDESRAGGEEIPPRTAKLSSPLTILRSTTIWETIANDRERRTTGRLFALLRYRAYSINSWAHALLLLIKPIAGPAARYAITHSTRTVLRFVCRRHHWRARDSPVTFYILARAPPLPRDLMNVAFRDSNWRAG
jgi:hypothetical protein